MLINIPSQNYMGKYEVLDGSPSLLCILSKYYFPYIMVVIMAVIVTHQLSYYTQVVIIDIKPVTHLPLFCWQLPV